MTIPAKIIADLNSLEAQVEAADPIEAAPFATIKAIQLNVRSLETDTTLALTNAAGLLDSWVAPNNEPGIIAGVLARIGEAIDQWRLNDMLMVISRAHLNIDLVIGEVQPPLK